MIAIVAESRISGITQTARRWGISKPTVHNYINRAAQSEEESRRVAEAVHALLADVRDQVVESLASGVVAVRTRMAAMENEDDAKCLEAISKTMKVLGELHICYETIDAELKTERQKTVTVEASSSDGGAITVRAE